MGFYGITLGSISIGITTTGSTAGNALDKASQQIQQHPDLTPTQKAAGTTQIENIRTELGAAVNYGENLFNQGVTGIGNLTTGISNAFGNAISNIAGYTVGRNTATDAQQYSNYEVDPHAFVNTANGTQSAGVLYQGTQIPDLFNAAAYNESEVNPAYNNLLQAADGGTGYGGLDPNKYNNAFPIDSSIWSSGASPSVDFNSYFQESLLDNGQPNPAYAAYANYLDTTFNRINTYTGQLVPNDSLVTDWNSVTVADDFSGISTIPIGYGFSLAPESQGGGIVFTITIPTTANSSSPNLVINGTLPDGAAGQLYKTTSLSVSGGTSPYVFSVDSNALPTGLALSTDGIVSGTIDVAAAVGTYVIEISATDSASLLGVRNYIINVKAALLSSTPVQTLPLSAIPPVTADNENFRQITGICYIQPDKPSSVTALSGVLSAQYVGAEFITTKHQPLMVRVYDIEHRTIPAGTTVYLNDQNGNPLLSAYSGVDELSAIYLYYTPSVDTQVFTVTVQTDHNGRGWIPVTTLSATGTGRIIQGSNRAAVWGPAAGNYPYGYGCDLYASGSLNSTYIRNIDIKDSFDYVVENGQYYNYRIANQGYQNPYYGTLVSNLVLVEPYGYEIGYSSISPSASALPIGGIILNTVVEFSLVHPLIQSTTNLELYTPYSFALTNQSVWLQTVKGYSYSKYRVDWGDGNIETYTNSTPTSPFFFTHTYSNARNTPYTVIVTALDNGNNQLYSTTLSSQFYIQDTFPELNLADYSKTLSKNPTLPYSFNDVAIGSNEYAVTDIINNAFGKLETNFQYLNTVTRYIKKSPNLEFVEWLADFILYPTWNTLFDGSNTFTYTLSSAYIGVSPGEITDFKSYKSPFVAPDYYNYIVFTTPGNNSSVQIRKNDFVNTPVLTLSSVVPGAQNFNAYSIDVSATNLFVLGEDLQGNGSTTLYKFNIDYSNGTATIVNKIGGAVGSRTDHYQFGQNSTDHASDIKIYNNKVYVADKINSCIKVYNSSLTWQSTIFNTLLSGYNMHPFDIKQDTGDIFVLGSIKAPNAPVITSVTSQASGNNITYSVTWNHDGNRLIKYDYNKKNFRIYGQVEGSGNYTLVDTVYSDLTHFTDSAKLTTYIFTTTKTYTSFSIQAIGQYGIDSKLSSSSIVPNQDFFPSPWAIFIFNGTSLKRLLTISEVPATAKIIKILIEPTGTFFYVVTDSYIYKYTVLGQYINRISDPSVDTLNETFNAAFIDERNYFHLATKSRIFKFIDIAVTEDLFNYDTITSYYQPSSNYVIGESEFIQDWVYNKALNQIINNHNILAKSINKKFVETVDYENNLVSFVTRDLMTTEVINTLSASESNYIHANEIVSSAVVNRTLEQIYNIQVAILEAVLPEQIILPSLAELNILGKNTAATPNIVHQYIQPPLIYLHPTGTVLETLVAGNSATFSVEVSSASADAVISYQWYVNNVPITGATTATYTIPSTTLSNAGTYYCIAADNVEPVKSPLFNLGVNLGSQFAFAAAQFVGNLYSNYLPAAGTITNSDVGGEADKWETTRYGNDYIAEISIINATTLSKLSLQLSETHGGDPTTFTHPVTVTINYNNSPIHTEQLIHAANISFPLSGFLTTDSSTAGVDGYPGTFTGVISVHLSLVPNSSVAYSLPKIVATVIDGGYLYNSNFTNAIYSSSTYSSSTLTLTGLSGNNIPYITIANNTLGGYLDNGISPYIRHQWAINGSSTTINPIANYAYASNSLTLSATRLTNPGETELVLSMGRTLFAEPAIPYYTITATTGSVSNGQGYVTGGGSFKAGSVQMMHAIGTYVVNYGPGQINDSPIIISGQGIFDAGRWYEAPPGGNTPPLHIAAEGSGIGSGQFSGSKFQVYVDGDKTVQVYFHH